MPTVNSSKVSVDEGKRTELSCQASQSYALREPITFGWFKVQQGSSLVSVTTNERVVNITSSSKQGRNYTGKLTFESAKRDDAGDYRCKAYNQYGTSELSAAAATLVVNCERTTCHTYFNGLLMTILCLLISS